MNASYRTKVDFGQALKQLMMVKPIEKITVLEICKTSGRNRNNFYYYFQDKYELLEWIFHAEITESLNQFEFSNFMDFHFALIDEINKQRDFFQAIFLMEKTQAFGKTPFSYFETFFRNEIKKYLKKYGQLQLAPSTIVTLEHQLEYTYDTYSMLIVANLQEWLLEKPEVTAAQYRELLKTVIYNRDAMPIHRLQGGDDKKCSYVT